MFNSELKQIILGDPTLKYFIYEFKLDPKHLDHQLTIRFGALRLALYQWIDKLG